MIRILTINGQVVTKEDIIQGIKPYVDLLENKQMERYIFDDMIANYIMTLLEKVEK